MNRKLTICCLVLVFQTLCGAAQAVTFNIFTDPHPTMGPGTVGFAYAGNKFVGSVLQNGTGSLYSTNLVGGNVQPFAPGVSLTSSSGEHFVAASFGLGGFPTSDIYAADGANIVHISNNGAASNSFVTGLAGEVRGISFDLVGTFGNRMLVTTSAGNVYQVNSAGTPSLLANVGEDVEGLDVAPLGNGFSVFDGQLIVASEGSGSIRAISPGGVVTPLSNGSSGGPLLINSAEELTFVPLNLGVSGNPLEGLYGANYTPNVLKADGSEFTGMEGDIIVTSEIGAQVRRIHWDGAQFVVTQIGSFPNQPEDGIFVTPKMISLATPEPSSLVLAALACLGLAARRWRRR
jgi:hypothetical protein